jgi:hypothetical protein
MVALTDEEYNLASTFCTNSSRILELHPYFLTLPFTYRAQKREAKQLHKENGLIIDKLFKRFAEDKE